MATAPDMNSVFIAVARREYIPVGSAPASMLAKATATNTKFTSFELAGRQSFWLYIMLPTLYCRKFIERQGRQNTRNQLV